MSCTAFASCFIAALASEHGPERLEAGLEELVVAKDLFTRAPYTFHETLLDEWVRPLRGRFGKDASPEAIAGRISLRAEIVAFAEELRRRIDSPERRRLVGNAIREQADRITDLDRRLRRIEEVLDLIDNDPAQGSVKRSDSQRHQDDDRASEE
ncbi:MAG: hypothetical protein AAF297_00790 [Planctomycetota bacterium]